jgi:hypothetical protein
MMAGYTAMLAWLAREPERYTASHPGADEEEFHKHVVVALDVDPELVRWMTGELARLPREQPVMSER